MSDTRSVATFEIPAPPSTSVRCVACANRACQALGQVPGVARVDCDATSSAVVVEFDADRVSTDDLAEEMSRFGLTLADSVHHAAWRVSGLD